MPSIVAPWSVSPGSSAVAGTKAPMSNVYTGRRAEQLMSGTTMIVASRSLGSSMVRVAMMPGTAHA